MARRAVQPKPPVLKCRACGCMEPKACIEIDSKESCAWASHEGDGMEITGGPLCTFCRDGYGVVGSNIMGNLLRAEPRPPLSEDAIRHFVKKERRGR
jgi:hypothetical protein